MAEVDAGLKQALEALLFVSDEPVAASVLAQALDADRRAVEDACEVLSGEYEERSAGLVLRKVAGGWRLFTNPDVAPILEGYVLSSRQARLTKASLETLAIVAYKQPVTRHQVSAIRGVNSDGVLKALVDRGIIAEVGREEGPGRPMLYGTTSEFLERLGLPSLASLPSLAPLLGSAAESAAADDVGQGDMAQALPPETGDGAEAEAPGEGDDGGE